MDTKMSALNENPLLFSCSICKTHTDHFNKTINAEESLYLKYQKPGLRIFRAILL